MEEILFCPKCGEAMIKQNHDFWKCPKCAGEWWPDSDKLAYLEDQQRAMTLEQQELHYARQRLCSASYKPVLPPVCVINSGKSSGGGRSGRKRKKPKRNPQLTTDRFQLC